MNADAIRSQLAQVEADIARTRQQLNALETIRDNYIVLLELQEGRAPAKSTRVSLAGAQGAPSGELRVTVRRRGRPRGGPSMRSTVLDVLRESGRPMRVTELVEAARARGFETTAQRKDSVMDLVVVGLVRDGHPIERVGPRTWEWVGGAAEQPQLLPTNNGTSADD